MKLLLFLLLVTSANASANAERPSFFAEAYGGYTNAEYFPTVDGIYAGIDLSAHYRYYVLHGLVTHDANGDLDPVIAEFGIVGTLFRLSLGRPYASVGGVQEPRLSPTDNITDPPARAVLLGNVIDSFSRSDVGARLNFRDRGLAVSIAAYQPRKQTIINTVTTNALAGVPVAEQIPQGVPSETLRGFFQDFFSDLAEQFPQFESRAEEERTSSRSAIYAGATLDIERFKLGASYSEIKLSGQNTRIGTLEMEYSDRNQTIAITALEAGKAAVLGASYARELNQKWQALAAGSVIRGPFDATEYSFGLGYQSGNFVGQAIFRHVSRDKEIEQLVDDGGRIEISATYRFFLQ